MAGASRLVPEAPLAAFAALALMAVFACTADAAQQWYTVEIIVFDVPGSGELGAEHWPAVPGEPSLEGAVELTPALEDAPGGGVHAFRLLDRADLSLNRVRSTLRRSARYRPLLHAGWRLPGLPRNAARPAYVGTWLAAAGSGSDPPAVRGTVKVSVARYLHVELDLLYRRSGDDVAVAPEGTPTWFRLESVRRMRSRELHYFDHPLFGVLVRITPFRASSQSAPEA